MKPTCDHKKSQVGFFYAMDLTYISFVTSNRPTIFLQLWQ